MYITAKMANEIAYKTRTCFYNADRRLSELEQLIFQQANLGNNKLTIVKEKKEDLYFYVVYNLGNVRDRLKRAGFKISDCESNKLGLAICVIEW